MVYILLIIIVFLFTLSVGMVIESSTPSRVIVDDKISDDTSVLYDEGD